MRVISSEERLSAREITLTLTLTLSRGTGRGDQKGQWRRPRRNADGEIISTAPIQLFPALRRTTVRRRLWMGGGAIGLFLLTLLVGNQFTPADKSVTREMLGHDFLAFYTAGSLVRQGRSHELYNLQSVRTFEQATGHAAGLEIGKSFGPWWNPPFYALLFEPLSKLPYPRALAVWRWINLIALGGAIALLCGMVRRSTGAGVATWGLVPLLVLTSMPFVQGFSHGQNTFTSLLLLTLAVVAWRGGRGVLAGAAAGLLFYKPQLAAVVALALIADLGWSAAAGVALSGVALLAINCVALPGTLGDFLHLLPANVRWMQVEHAYLWERHVTLKAFWRLLLQGREAGEALAAVTGLTAICMLAAGANLLRAWRRRSVHREAWRDRWIAATILAMPLLMPFYFDYDLLLLAVPAVLYGIEQTNRREAQPWLNRAWAVLFCWMFVNPPIAFHTHLNVTVLLVSALATLHANRAGRVTQPAAVRTFDPVLPLARAA